MESPDPNIENFRNFAESSALASKFKGPINIDAHTRPSDPCPPLSRGLTACLSAVDEPGYFLLSNPAKDGHEEWSSPDHVDG
jgi:hypothetical protein